MTSITFNNNLDKPDGNEGCGCSSGRDKLGCKANQDSGVGLDEITLLERGCGGSCNHLAIPTQEEHVGVVTTSLGGDEGGDKESGDRRHCKSSSLPHGVKLCAELKEGIPDPLSSPEQAGDKWSKLEDELRKAHTDLQAKDAEVEVLKGIRLQVEGELEDLTASLFEEAHKMVNEAKMKEVASEKSCKETRMQLEGLEAEVAALKALLITSTPSRPNLGGGGGSNGMSLFKKIHKRSPSHNHLTYGRNNEEDTNPHPHQKEREVVIDRSCCEVDPVLLGDFGAWRTQPSLTPDTPFLISIYSQDIEPCLEFSNRSLVKRLRRAIEDNSIWVEPLPEKERNNIPKDCALLQCPRVCHFRMRFAYDSEDWFEISQLCRDRIAAVCEFLNYLRYIKNGLVKASVEDAYWEILRLRKQMGLAKLGISIS